jgi:hypothetical protein
MHVPAGKKTFSFFLYNRYPLRWEIFLTFWGDFGFWVLHSQIVLYNEASRRARRLESIASDPMVHDTTRLFRGLFSNRYSRRSFAGMPLIELLAVLAVISLPLQLLIPAVQSACSVRWANKLHRLGMGMLAYQSPYPPFSSGRWSSGGMADPMRGSRMDQPGDWSYSLLTLSRGRRLHHLVFRVGRPETRTKPYCAAANSTSVGTE